MSYCFKISILVEICIKIRYFKKLQKITQRWGFRLPKPLASGGEAQDPQWPPENLRQPHSHLEILVTPLVITNSTHC